MRLFFLTFKVWASVLFCLLIFLSATMQCSYQETSNETSQTFTLGPGTEILFSHKDRYFLLVTGDTALFYGTEICTLITNGIVTSTTFDSSYYRSITFPYITEKVNDTPIYLIPQKCQQGLTLATLENDSIIRYFRKMTNAILQIKYFEDNSMVFVKKEFQEVIPTTLEVGSFNNINSANNNWSTVLLIKNPLPPINGSFAISSHDVGIKSIAQSGMPLFFLNGVYYSFGVEITTFSVFHGDASEGGNTYRYLGTLITSRKYFKNKGLIDENIQVLLQKTFDNGTVQLIKKTIIHQRGPEGALDLPDDISK